ncbi:hypothetical protein C2E31_07115 [Rhodopirellula baltica]|nr:hypothetical protein C2E31_07115 [Rhodopirellula baltica]
MQRLTLLLSLLFVCGCHSLSSHRIRADNRDEMIAGVSERIPVGTPLATARVAMENAGFECDLRDNASFAESPGIIGDDRDYKSISDSRFLYCQRTESAGFLVTHLWYVALVLNDDDNVADVLVLHRMDGP